MPEHGRSSTRDAGWVVERWAGARARKYDNAVSVPLCARSAIIGALASRSDLIRMLAELAKLTALDEGSPQAFKVRAYENAIAGIESHPGEMAGIPKTELTKIKGVGNSTADKILEFEETGQVGKLESLREKYPPPFVELTKIPGLGPKTLLTLRFATWCRGH